jgi:hypothetical protein
MVDLVVSAVDAVTEEDRTTLAPRWWQKSGLCATLGNTVFDYGHRQGSCRSDANFMGETCTIHGYKLQTGHQQ